MRSWLAIGAVVVALGPVHPARAQVIVPTDEWAEYYRLLELEGRVEGLPLIYRSASTLSRARPASDSTPWSHGVSRLSARIHTVFNSRYPGVANDGALWAGRGL